MKKLIAILWIALVLFSCSKEEETTVNETFEADFSKIVNPDTATPNTDLDRAVEGLYIGVFVSADTQHHGIITVNLENDGNINAIIAFDNQDRLGYVGQQLDERTYSFKARNSSFDVVISDNKQAEVVNAKINDQLANGHIVKDHSTNRSTVMLGTFVDDSNPNFGGTWDFVSSGTTVITIPIPVPPFSFSFTANTIDELVVCYDDGTPSGIMFTDNSMESFTGTGACPFVPPSPLQPFFTGPQTLDIPLLGLTDVDEYAAFDQSSTLGNHVSTWNLGYSLVAGTGGNQEYVDNNCDIVPGGVWSWNGRNGSFIFN